MGVRPHGNRSLLLGLGEGMSIGAHGVWTDPRPLRSDNLQKSVYATPGNTPPNNASALTAQRLYAARFTVPRLMSIQTVSIAVTTAAGADDAAEVGLLDASGNKIISSGVLTGKLNALGCSIFPLVTTLLPNTVYYSCFLEQAASTAQLASFQLGSTNCAILNRPTAGTTGAFPWIEQAFQAAQASIPTTMTPSVLATAPVLCFREF
jgi:hypothetical protein